MELDSGIGGGEAPGDRAGAGVAVALPGGRFVGQRLDVRDASAEALATEDAQLDLTESISLHILCMLGVPREGTAEVSRAPRSGDA